MRLPENNKLFSWRSWREDLSSFQPFKTFKPFKFPASLRRGSGQAFLPRVAGEDEGGGLIVLNALNILNLEA
jgi:hypothetical protein